MKHLAGALLVITVSVVLSAVVAVASPDSLPPTIGSTITTKRVRVTLYGYRQSVPVDASAATAGVGSDVAAVDIKACNRSAGIQTVGRYQFFLETPDHHLVFPANSISAPRPQFRTTALARGRCTRGWLSYAVPGGIRAADVVFQAGAMFTNTLHRWEVPKG